MSNYIDLHCHSTFSSAMTHGDAVGSPTEIVARAVELGWGAVCLTEHGWLGSAPALYKLARKEKIKPIFGCEFYVTPDFALGQQSKDFKSLSYHLTVLALSFEGYQNLVAWTTEAMQRENYYHKPRISLFRMAEIAPHPLHHNVCLSGCLGSELSGVLQSANGSGLAIGAGYVEQMKAVFPNFYIEIWNHEIPKFIDSAFPAYVDLIEREAKVRKRLIKLAEITNTPLVVTNDSHMPTPKHRKTHIAIKATSWQHRDDDHMGSSDAQELAKFLPDYTYFGNYMRDMEKVADGLPSQALESVAEIVQEANIIIDPLESFSYSIPPSGISDPIKGLRHRAKKRLASAVAKYGTEARDRFEMELDAMGSFADYLLLMADFIQEAHRQGILTWTRGSAANSFLAYCIGIHEIDSIEYGLVFSRFFNPARKKLPDIDVDIDPDRYEDFIRIVQEKMEPLVGKGQIVPMGNWLTAANRSAFRAAANALGVPKETQDEIARLLPQMIDEGVVEEDADAFLAIKEEYPEIYELTSEIFDSIKGVGQHACAWLFGTPDRPIEDFVPMYLIASSGKLVTQYDFKALEDFGLTKMDFLRLKTLTVAAKTLRALGRSPLEFYDLPVDDPNVFKMFREGKTEGVHTVQGKEVRRGCMEIGVENVHDVILAGALYRPANTRVDRDKLYVERRHGHEKVKYQHSILEKIVGPTLGVPVFQEQAMEICYAVGMDDAGVDDIYQAIKKAKGAGRGAKQAFKEVRPKFIEAARKTIKKAADRKALWEFVKAFQGYGFNKGHASSYGVLACKMGYLKYYHPGEYYAGLLDTFPDKPTYIAAAREDQFGFLGPCVNRSAYGFSLDRSGSAIRVGLKKVDGLGPVAVREILDGQPYSDLEDFHERTTRRAVNSTRVETLATVGALEMLGVQAGHSDADEFHKLGIVLNKPKAFKGVKPKHTSERTSQSGWRHLGRERGLASTPSRSSVSKLFWIPPEPEPSGRRKGDQYLKLESSPWAHVKTWLMTVVDENGLPFHLMVNEDKTHEVRLLKFLHDKCYSAVICADGMIRLPFKTNGPQGFRFFGITGSYNGEPQIFGLPENKERKYKLAIAELDRMKRNAR